MDRAGILEFELPAVRESIPIARGRVSAWAEARGLAEGGLQALKVAVSEAVANAALHAYREGPPGTVRVALQHTATHLSIKVEDFGVGMKPRPDSPALGLGLPLIARLVSRLEIICTPEREAGAEIRMVLRFDPDNEPLHDNR